MEKRPPLPYIILKEYLLKKGIINPGYEDLLWTEEWLNLREEIKRRDNYTCTICFKSRYKKMSDDEFLSALAESGYGKYFNLLEGIYEATPAKYSTKKNNTYPSDFKIDSSVTLEVHHKFYIWNNLPWEYDLSVLTTLCADCHWDEHNRPIIYTDKSFCRVMILQNCEKCGGKGHLPEYFYVQNGICFNCGGLGGV